MSFDLTDRPWLPVQLFDGSQTVLSLREIFARAGSVRRLAGDVPTQDFALVRLLVAILHDALDGPQDLDDWAELWESDEPFAPVPGYLDSHRQRFDLLHPVSPFFQTPGLRTAKGEVFPLDRIVADVPNGTLFFTMRPQGAKRISFAEAACWVVHAQAYDTSGIKTGVVGDERAKAGKAYPQGVAWAGSIGGVLAEGPTLRETLLLNLIAADGPITAVGGKDRPAWRGGPARPGAAADLALRPYGVRDLYTWQSRRLLLHADADGVHGVVLTYGDPLPPQNRQGLEPMSGWRRSQAQEKKHQQALVYMPQEHDPARAAWRGLAALIAPRDHNTAPRGEPPSRLRPGLVDWIARLINERVLPDRMLIRIRTYGVVYGTQQSVVDEITEDAVTLSVVLLSEADRGLGQCAVDAVADAETAVTALGALAAALAQASGSEVEAPKDTARDLGFGALDGPYRAWLAALHPGDDPQQARAQWQQTARRTLARIGAQLVAQAGEAARQGRVIELAKGGQLWLNSASADLRFRTRLNACLPLASPPAPGSEESPGGRPRKVSA
ncbi:type I-E CRISPR-associated protein Cse1/CasA [Streptomyces kanamyceticus]|uniref:Type I-E CRISPR-associated protein Cse1/CasA n=1 Tax=Streptomyces kanamyceticus TaxID=1967 RepID=A0A5J6GTK2_STRKN|nr:type I-E CRISPR-associated protein Cse1/CasA [Streptomyces kanamyceticus]